MSTILDLHNAIRALRPDGITHYPGQAPAEPEAPWIVTGFRAPEITTSEAGRDVARTGTLTVTVTGLTEDQANFIAAEVLDAFTGERVAVDGYSTGALIPADPTGPYPAGLDAADTNLRYQVVRVPFQFTYSRTT